MDLENLINEGIKTSIKSGDKIRLETLRSIRASIIEFNKSGVNRKLDESDAIKILNSAANKRKDAIELYEQGGRLDLAEKERKELDIILEFLPKKLSQNELEMEIKRIINQVGASSIKDIGKVMGQAMKELAGIADGSEVQKIVRELLSNV